MGHPSHNLEQAMARFGYVMRKFGLTKKKSGVTSHGLRHEGLIDEYEKLTGHAAPVRGGAKLSKTIDTPARQEVAELAGHTRRRASSAYLGSSIVMRSKATHLPLSRDIVTH